MSYMSVASMAIGALGQVKGAAGAYLKGKSGDIFRNRLNSIADTPGVDIGEITGQALENEQKFLPQAERLVRSEAVNRQSLVNDLQEQSLPGFTGLLGQATAIDRSLLAGEVPDDIRRLLQDQAASGSLGSVGRWAGLGPGTRGQAGLLRSLGLTSIGQQQQGLSWLQAIRGLAPTVQPQSALSFTGPNANQLTDIRSKERAMRMELMAKAAGIPGQTAAWADYLTGSGNADVGYGMGSFNMKQFAGSFGQPSMDASGLGIG